jgi:hypothetical protein
MGEIVQGNFKRLTAQEILEQDDVRTEDVEVPEWNAIVTIRSLTGVERDRLEAAMVTEKGGNRSVNFTNFRAKLIAATAVDSDGRHLFTPQQVEPLGKKNAMALSRLFNVASRLSGYSDDDVRELTVELGNDPSVEIGSDSQGISALVPSASSKGK